MRRSSDLSPEIAEEAAWWRDAVFYQVYVRSFADGERRRRRRPRRHPLPAAATWQLLGVDALWLTPFYRSPMADHGYDVADPRDVDPMFGDLAAFDRLVADAHEHDIRVTIDLVPEPHLRPARVVPGGAGRPVPGSTERARYIFRDGPRLRRRAAAEQLDLGLRRPGVDPGAGRPVVPAPVRAGAARPELGPPRGPRRPGAHAAVLAGPRRRRLPHRRGARHGQARRPAGHGVRARPPACCADDGATTRASTTTACTRSTA